ncbi:sugar transferase [Candidatus Pelagibacter sp.]|nr:sugar transferase [Candidatus Pelagibacter sp.]
MGKRLFDIIFSLVALLSLFPILIIICLLIKLFDTGPIIYKQKRIGLNSKIFIMYKLRSMPVNTFNIPSNKIKKLKLNWINKFIRRTNIDEVPQLINILKGDMSIVGPRPALPSQKNLIKYRKRTRILFFRPGLTGLAQISSYDGMKDIEKVNFDKKYTHSVSFKKDLLIILNTFKYLLKPPPVY